MVMSCSDGKDWIECIVTYSYSPLDLIAADGIPDGWDSSACDLVARFYIK